VDITKYTNEELMNELDKRSIVRPGTGPCLVIGTMCDYPEGPAVEVFKEVKKPEDMLSRSVYMRARMNGHRNYRMFYFKTDSFNDLDRSLNEDPRSFAEWVEKSDSMKFGSI